MISHGINSEVFVGYNFRGGVISPRDPQQSALEDWRKKCVGSHYQRHDSLRSCCICANLLRRHILGPGLTPSIPSGSQSPRVLGPGGKLDDVAIVCGVVRDGVRPGLRVVHNFNGAPTDAAPAVNEETRDTAPDVALPPFFAYQNQPATQGSRNNFPQFLV